MPLPGCDLRSLLQRLTKGLKVHGASMESQGETNAYSEYDSNQDESVLVGIAKLIENLGSFMRNIQAMADSTQCEVEQSILGEVLKDVRSAFLRLENHV